jgi:hypothetical protein
LRVFQDEGYDLASLTFKSPHDLYSQWMASGKLAISPAACQPAGSPRLSVDYKFSFLIPEIICLILESTIMAFFSRTLNFRLCGWDDLDKWTFVKSTYGFTFNFRFGRWDDLDKLIFVTSIYGGWK